MAFEGKTRRASASFATPEEMYLAAGTLPRDPAKAAPGLWVHQGDAVRAYAHTYRTNPDVAFELPTGSGKTLPGLLIVDWVRREERAPVAYVAPTTQLAHQVADSARNEGVAARVLVGSHHDWPLDAEVAVESGEAIAITNYSTVFNSAPKLTVPRLLIFDDAHAAAQFVADQYAVTIGRRDDLATYVNVLDAIKPMIDGVHFQRLLGTPDPGAHHQVRLLMPGVRPDVLTALDATLAGLTGSNWHKFAMIRAGLQAACVFVSYAGIQIRPMVPPTHTNKVFAGATQRLYLSATLGRGGELERAFGRTPIVRVPAQSASKPRSGRRLFVFPDVAEGDGDALTAKIVARTNKAVVLTQDTVEAAEQAARDLAGAGITVYGKAEVDAGLGTFKAAATGVIGLSNRYDGLDLPGKSCRVVVIDGLPSAASLAEKFLGERADARAALAERLRTRIVQGAGRCTRGPGDWAVVVIRGADITKYFSREENRLALDTELQAEVDFGWSNSRGKTHDTVLENVNEFLDQTQVWREHGETALAEFLADAATVEAPGAAALGDAAADEVAAWELAGAGKWLEASEAMQAAARRVGSGGDATRGYRAFCLYLAGVWLSFDASTEPVKARARDLVRQAAKAGSPTRTTWLREMPDLPGSAPVELTGADVVAVNAIAATLAGKFNPTRTAQKLTEMVANLNQDSAGPYEQGLTTMGAHLGARAFKPAGQGRCDSAWLWDTTLWLTLEAKSEQTDGLLPLHDIRQANTQMDQLAHDEGVAHAPASSPVVLISDRLAPDPQHAAVANENVYLADKTAVTALAADVASVWQVLATAASGLTGDVQRRAVVQDVLTQHGCLPAQVIDRLTGLRIRPEA